MWYSYIWVLTQARCLQSIHRVTISFGLSEFHVGSIRVRATSNACVDQNRNDNQNSPPPHPSTSNTTTTTLLVWSNQRFYRADLPLKTKRGRNTVFDGNCIWNESHSWNDVIEIKLTLIIAVNIKLSKWLRAWKIEDVNEVRSNDLAIPLTWTKLLRTKHYKLHQFFSMD